MAESDTWEGRKNLNNTKETIEEFKKEYQQDMEDVAWQEHSERNIQKRRITREIHSKEIIWMVEQKVQSRILGKIGKKLETVEREMIKGKKNRNDYRRRRN